MEDLISTPFFFIVGRPRSGTTLLRTLFDANKNVCIPPECQFIINLHPRYGKLIQWNENDMLAFYKDLKEQWLFKTWKVNSNILRNALLAAVGKITYNEVCKIVNHQYQSFYEKGEILFFGDKNPGYTIYTEQLMKIFPNAKFIHIIRDYRDHYVSIRNVDFDFPIPSLVAFKWRLFVKKFRKMKEKYPNSHLEIRYEDLVSEPENQMKQLCDFTNIPFDPKIFQFYEKEDEARNIYSSRVVDKIHSSLFSKINPSKIGVYKKKLSARQIKMADFAVGKYAELAGYKKDYEKANLGIVFSAVPGIAIAKSLQILTRIVDHFPYRLRAFILNRLPLKLAMFYWKIFNPQKLTDLFRTEAEQ